MRTALLLVSCAALAVGLGVGYLLGSRCGGSETGTSRAATDPRTPRDAPALDGIARSGPAEPPGDAKTPEDYEREVAALRAERDALRAELDRPQPEEGSVEAFKQRELAYYTRDPGFSRDDLRKAGLSSRSSTGLFPKYLIALHEKDIGTYLDAVWEARMEAMASVQIVLSPEDGVAIGAIFREQYLAHRAWVRSDYLPRLQAAQTRAELDAARFQLTLHYAENHSQVVFRVATLLRPRPGGEALWDRVSHFL